MQIAWIFIQREADWKPIQFLAFAFVYRIFEKLKASEPSASSSFSVSESEAFTAFFSVFTSTILSDMNLC